MAIAATLGILLIRLLLEGLLERNAPMLLFTVAVLVAAYFGGLGPGLLATGLSVVAGGYLFIEPGDRFWPVAVPEQARMVLFILTGAAISFLCHRLWVWRRRESQSEERFRLLVENVKEYAIFHLDPLGRVTSWNAGAARIMQYGGGEILGQHFARFYEPLQEQTDRPQEDLRIAAETGQFVGEAWLARKDGTHFWGSVTITALRGETGELRGFAQVIRDISERRRTMEELRSTEQRMRAIFDNAGVGLVEVDRDDRIIAANDRLCKILGYAREQLLGMTVHDLTYPDDRAITRKLNQQLHDGQRDRFEYEKRYLRQDGRPLWVRVTVSSVRDQHGTWLRSIGVIEDITKRKQAEAALRESEDRFREAFARAPVGMALTDHNGRFLQVNPAYCRLVGFEEHQLVGTGLTFRDLTHPDDLDKNVRVIDQLLSGEIPAFFCEKRYIHKDGQPVWVRASVTARRDPDGQPLQLVAVVENIDDRKRTEEELRRSEEFAQKILASSISGLYIYDLRLARITYISPQYTRLTGYALADLEAMGADMLELFHPNDRQRVLSHIASAASARDEQVREIEYRFRTRDGRWIWCLSRETVFARDVDGSVRQYLGTFLDVTQRKQAEEESHAAKHSAEQARAAAEEANRAKDHFLAVLSHELRTPLTPVLAGVSMLQAAGEQFDPDTRDQLAMIRRNVEMEAKLIDDLLDMTRIAKGKIELDLRPIEFCEIVRRAVEVVRPEIEARNLHFAIELGSCSGCCVNADAGRLQQVFWNLLNNAIKFTPRGGSIKVICALDGHDILAEVVDSGVGMDPQALERIFNAFEQAERTVTRQFGGLGLGLAISRTLVELHGGRISAHSEGRGRGSRFTIRLPLSEGAHCRVTPHAIQHGEGANGYNNGAMPLRILLVEDHADTARVMRRLLLAGGHQVSVATDVNSALQTAGDRRFDLLISDLGLPDGSGIDLICELRRRGNEMAAIALSGYGQEEDIARSRGAGFAEHLTKPVNIERLHEVIAETAAKAR